MSDARDPPRRWIYCDIMTSLHNPAELIQKNLDQWSVPYVELDIFRTDNAGAIAGMVNAFCEEHLGPKVRGYLFYAASVGSTHGVVLEDDRKVVIKARPPATENLYLNLGLKKIETVCAVMNWLHSRGFPCPRPILGPKPLGRGLATVEEYMDDGGHGNAFEPACRKTIASTLAELIRLLRSCDINVESLEHTLKDKSSLYPQPHGKIFNFETTSAGAEWIDDFARRAQSARAHEEENVLGHADWRVEHLRFRDGNIAAAYDWDSLSLRPETELVGISAHGFTADWSLPEVRRIPAGADIRSYIADYEHARGRPFSKQERRAVFSSCVYWIAYNARCQHSLFPDKTEWEKDTYPYLLLTEGKALLAEAGL